jgi:putative tryptophan/tyrosine transport system substrate-binding protein
MRRRAFITLLGGSAAWPLAASAQERVRQVGVLGGYAAHDPEVAPRAAALQRSLEALGWSDGRNIRIDYRF